MITAAMFVGRVPATVPTSVGSAWVTLAICSTMLEAAWNGSGMRISPLSPVGDVVRRRRLRAVPVAVVGLAERVLDRLTQPGRCGVQDVGEATTDRGELDLGQDDLARDHGSVERPECLVDLGKRRRPTLESARQRVMASSRMRAA